LIQPLKAGWHQECHSAPKGEMARSGKKRDSQAFSRQTPHSAPFREMATCASAPEKNAASCHFGRVVARSGESKS
jgi:hypothetical protein